MPKFKGESGESGERYRAGKPTRFLSRLTTTIVPMLRNRKAVMDKYGDLRNQAKTDLAAAKNRLKSGDPEMLRTAFTALNGYRRIMFYRNRFFRSPGKISLIKELEKAQNLGSMGGGARNTHIRNMSILLDRLDEIRGNQLPGEVRTKLYTPLKSYISSLKQYHTSRLKKDDDAARNFRPRKRDRNKLLTDAKALLVRIKPVHEEIDKLDNNYNAFNHMYYFASDVPYLKLLSQLHGGNILTKLWSERPDLAKLSKFSQDVDKFLAEEAGDKAVSAKHGRDLEMEKAKGTGVYVSSTLYSPNLDHGSYDVIHVRYNDMTKAEQHTLDKFDANTGMRLVLGLAGIAGVDVGMGVEAIRRQLDNSDNAKAQETAKLLESIGRTAAAERATEEAQAGAGQETGTGKQAEGDSIPGATGGGTGKQAEGMEPPGEELEPTKTESMAKYAPHFVLGALGLGLGITAAVAAKTGQEQRNEGARYKRLAAESPEKLVDTKTVEDAILANDPTMPIGDIQRHTDELLDILKKGAKNSDVIVTREGVTFFLRRPVRPDRPAPAQSRRRSRAAPRRTGPAPGGRRTGRTRADGTEIVRKRRVVRRPTGA
ncbi:MAG: hypothetical protein KAY24_09990 [Candidatus Eisenbacteria sp.]|nr:hypothetical protein [Candidatus Eisenbacteria bacterium]